VEERGEERGGAGIGGKERGGERRGREGREEKGRGGEERREEGGMWTSQSPKPSYAPGLWSRIT